MPGRLRQSVGQSATKAQDEGHYNIDGLEYSQALTWRAGKAIPVAELLSRLQKLGDELRALEQGQIPAKEFRQLAQDLAHSNLLGHKDKGVRAWALCCVVDILNICAPDAPFNPAQLRDIFKVVNNLLQNLDDPSNAYNAQHVYILNSLTDTKSIVLITDLERSEELITPLFRICFDIVSGASQNASGQELAKSVEFQLRSMLVTIIDEANLPQEAIDVILSQYLRVDPRTQQEPSTKNKKQDVKDKKQDTLHLKDYPPAYNMAKSICTTCTEKMTAYVTQYVGTIIMNASAALNEEVPPKNHGRKPSEADESDDGDESLGDLKKAHRLVRELWRACPDVLINVIPQIEAELHADSASLRQLATETLGDIIAGIGISGPPLTTTMDPTAFPLPSVDEPEPGPLSTNPLLIPASPKPFASIHASTFQAFIGRRVDKSSSVRSAWSIAVSRVLLTEAGGIGLSSEHRNQLLSGYAAMLKDIDDKVRQSAIQNINNFSYNAVVDVLAADGGVSVSDTILSNLADRVIDKKSNVQEDAVALLSRIWGTASRDIQNGVERVINAVGGIPARICNSMYTNDIRIHMNLDKALYENVLPITFPPVKTPPKGESQKRSKNNSQDASNIDADHIRVQRILTFIRSLDPKAKQVFYGIQKRQVDMSRAVKAFLNACVEYNGGVVDDNTEEQKLKDQLTKYIQTFAKMYWEPSKATADLWKFVNMHDRRNYQLIRFATEPEHDYRTMSKAIKELTKRIKEGSSSTQSIMETLLPLLYRSVLIVYNRSHVPAIMEISRTDEADLAETAHEVLKEISAKNPEVLKTHIQALCKELEENAPSATKPESPSAADTLKACAGFARKYPTEGPKERKFLTAMINYALYSKSPRAAKHAVTIILTVTDKKELHAKELMSKAVKDCKPDSAHYLARLATIAQVYLLAPPVAAVEEDVILDIVLTNCLQKNQSPEVKTDANAWEDTPSDETIAKELALKVLVNRCRSADDKTSQNTFDVLANNVIAVLMNLVEKDGEMTETVDTPPAQRNRLRLTAAHYILKLCSHKRRCEELVTPKMFIAVALIVINPPNAVRNGFVHCLQKYLGRGMLNARWHTICFLIAFEPDVELKNKTVGWLKSRVAFYNRQRKSATAAPSERLISQQAVMENMFTRLLSLLAHHPDYPDPESSDFESELLDFSRYIVFYLQCVASEDNISLIFHIAQRVKQTRDGIAGTDESSERLYVLSDLAQAVIRNYADLMPAHAKGVNLLQTWPGKVTLPTSLFAALPSSTAAQEIAAKNYLPEDVAVGLEKLVRTMVRGGKSRERQKATAPADRKRKSDSVDLDDSEVETKTKKVRKSSTLPIRRTPKVNKRKQRDGEKDADLSVEQPSRKSARRSAVKTYAESDDEEDDTMDDAVASSPVKPRKSALARKATPQKTVEEEEEEEDEEVAENNEDEDDEAASQSEAEVEPEVESAHEDDDIEMTEDANGDHDIEETEEAGEAEDTAADATTEEDAVDEETDELPEAATEEENEKEEGDTNPDAEAEDSEEEGTPSPKPKPRATRATRGAASKPNGASKPSARAKSKSTTTPTPAEKQAKSTKATKPQAEEEAVRPKRGGKATASSTAAVVSKLNETAGTKGNGRSKKAAKEVESAMEDVASSPAPAPAATRRSGRTRS